MALAACVLGSVCLRAVLATEQPLWLWDREDNVKYDDKHESQRVGRREGEPAGVDTVRECRQTCTTLARCKGFSFDGTCKYYSTDWEDATTVEALGSSIYYLIVPRRHPNASTVVASSQSVEALGTGRPETSSEPSVTEGGEKFHNFVLVYKTGHIGNEMAGYWLLRAIVRTSPHGASRTHPCACTRRTT
jgi:hypothetical protein